MYRSIIPRETRLRESSSTIGHRLPIKCPPQFAIATSARVFAHPVAGLPRTRAAVQFDPVASPAILADSTPHFHVYYASIMGQRGDEIAQGVLKNCERDYKVLADFFGHEKSLNFNVLIAPLSARMDGSGGAYHHSCLATDLYCDAQLSPPNPDVTNALVVAEEVEVFEALQGEGWRCGGSNGEGLSRVLASELYPNVLESLGYSTAHFWLNSRRPNLVRRTLPTDTKPIANGCSVLFLNYLHTQLGFTWNEICQAAAPTLAGTYRKLTKKKRAFAEFASLLGKSFPKGEPADLKTDNPFPIKTKIGAATAAKKAGKRKTKGKGDGSTQ